MENGVWEFDCPQFVDFAAGLDNSPKNHVWLGQSSRKQRNRVLSSIASPGVGPKMCTPKLKQSGVLKPIPFINVDRPLQTDDEKLNTLKSQRRLSRSEDFLNRLGVRKQIGNPLPRRNPLRRSLSENCLKVKKRICPTTPMCLKRTLSKPKTNRKTTEELELEKIEELRDKLSRQIKLNQVNMQRIKNNKNPYLSDDLYKLKPRNEAPKLKDESKDLKTVPNQLFNDVQKHGKSKFINEDLMSMPSNSKDKSHLALKAKSARLQNVLKSVQTSVRPSNALRTVNQEENGERNPCQRRPIVKYKGHSGLKFLPIADVTTPQPFKFDTSSISQSSFRSNNSRAHFSTSLWISSISKDKENVYPELTFPTPKFDRSHKKKLQ